MTRGELALLNVIMSQDRNKQDAPSAPPLCRLTVLTWYMKADALNT